MDRISDLVVFVAVVETGSMTAAAQRLDSSPAAVSKRILALEERLGARLLARTTRRLAVTDDGRAYYERCKPILEELEDAEAMLAGARSGARGLLRVTVPASFGRRHISPWIAHFMKAHPALRIDLVLSDALLDLVDGGFDVAIRIGSLSDSSLVARRIAPNRRVLCAAPAYLAQHGTPRHPRELAAHNCLLLESSGGREQSWRLAGDDGEHTIRVTGNFMSNNGEVLRDAALAGLGIAMKSTWDVADDLRSGQLLRLLPDYTPAVADIFAVYPHRRHLSAKVRLFVDALEERIGSEPYWDKDLT